MLNQRFITTAFVSPATTVVAVTVGIVVDLCSPGQVWPGDLLLASEWLSTSFFLVSGVVCGVAALDGYLRFHPDRNPWLRKPRQVLTTAVRWTCAQAMAIGLPAATAAVLMAQTVDFQQVHPSVLRAAFVQLVLSAISLLILALMGLVNGTAFGRWGVVFSVAFGYAIGMRAMDDHWMPLTFGGVNGSMVAMTIPAALQATQALTLAVVMMACLVITAALPGSRPEAFRALAIVLALSVGYTMALGSSQRRYVSLPVAEQIDSGPCMVDQQGRATTCSTPEHRRLLESAAQLHDEAVASGHKLGIELPRLALERVNGQRARTNVIYWYASPQALARHGRIDREQFLSDVATPAWCPGLQGDAPPSDDFFTRADTLARLLAANRDSRTPPSDQSRSQAQRLWKSLSQCEGAS